MYNRDIYQVDPESRQLVNDGVANVNDDTNTEALKVLKYELETFVCDGQYAEGMKLILETFFKNINHPTQPAVWVSGFYGSGKSHLVKMLRALWTDNKFHDGSSARGIVNLPTDILELFTKLTEVGENNNGLHALSGTLGSGAQGSVRLTILGMIFKSIGLPEKYHLAKFVMWLREEKLESLVRSKVIEQGGNWEEELANLFVAEELHEILVALKPGIFSDLEKCSEILNNQYPFVNDISNEEMLRTIKQALSKGNNNIPLTLIVLDEIQQFIGEDSQKSFEIQEIVESCSKNFAGRLLFIGTGQTAITGTPNLKKLEGRFTVRIELTDTEVDTVVRKVILAKKPSAISPLKHVLATNDGEISRHLAGTSLEHSNTDRQYFVEDYPILPSRRRFWEKALRILDQTGTESQLRNQLTMTYKVIQTNLDKPLGNVIPADYLYFDSADKLLQAHILPRNLYESTSSWIKGTDKERLWARACGIVFLINKISNNNEDIGIKADIDTIADLLVEDLMGGSISLRSDLNTTLDTCPLIMKVGDEYRIQTKESAAWNDEFLSQQSSLSSTSYLIESDRDQLIRNKFLKTVRRLNLTQGSSNIPRNINYTFDSILPPESSENVYVWIRNGWSTNENAVLSLAKQSGNTDPTIFVFIPKYATDELRHNLILSKAAQITLDKKGATTTPEGKEARAAMETYKSNADNRIDDLLDNAFADITVIQSGGNYLSEENLLNNIALAAQNSYERLYPQFKIADHTGWALVYQKAKKGDPDALKNVDFADNIAKNQVCKQIIEFIVSEKSGSEIRSKFEKSPYGWPKDSIDGALQILMVSGLIKAIGNRGEVLDPTKVERKYINQVIFKVENITLSTSQLIQIKKIFQLLDIKNIPNGQESLYVSDLIASIKKLAHIAGGEPPKPVVPDLSFLSSIEFKSGNEQLMEIYNKREQLLNNVKGWKGKSETIQERWNDWNKLLELKNLTDNNREFDSISNQIKIIINDRLLLSESDLLKPLIKETEDLLRKILTNLKNSYDKTLKRCLNQLEENIHWKNLNSNEQEILLNQCGITTIKNFDLGNYTSLVSTLNLYPLQTWHNSIDALPNKFNRLTELIAKSAEPGTQIITLKKVTLKSSSDVENWIKEQESELLKAVKNGPIIIR